MFGALGAKQMEKMMKQMGINTNKIEATKVIIKTPEKDIVITDPEITVIEMKGEKSFQIVGKISEGGFSEEDIKVVAEQAGVSEDEAKEALEEEKDIAKAIMKLKA